MRKFTRLSIALACAVVLLLGNMTARAGETEVTFGFMTSLSGTFAGVGETQRKAYIYAVERQNELGGLDMPWGKVKINQIIADDEAKLDIGVQRFRDMVQKGAIGVTGGIWNPLSAVLNEEAKIEPMMYTIGYVPAIDIFRKDVPADCMFTAVYSPWTLGYLCGQAAIQELGKKKLYYVERSDSWGQTIKVGLEQACKDFGGEIVGVSSVPLGTSEYSAVVNLALQSGADAFVTSMFGGDAIANIKQAGDMGLLDKAVIINCSITNVVAEGLPPAALENLYGIAYFYWDMSTAAKSDAAARVKEFAEGYLKRWGEQPDAMSGSVYVGMETMFRGAEKAGSFDPLKVAEVLLKEPIETIKGTTYFRKDHQIVVDEACFLVRGKGPSERNPNIPNDLFEIVKTYGGPNILPSLEYMGY